MPNEPNNKQGDENLSIVVIECGMMIWSYMDISAKNRTFVLFVEASLQSAVHHYSNINFARKHIYNADDLCVPARSAPYYPHTNK